MLRLGPVGKSERQQSDQPSYLSSHASDGGTFTQNKNPRLRFYYSVKLRGGSLSPLLQGWAAAQLPGSDRWIKIFVLWKQFAGGGGAGGAGRWRPSGSEPGSVLPLHPRPNVSVTMETAGRTHYYHMTLKFSNQVRESPAVRSASPFCPSLADWSAHHTQMHPGMDDLCSGCRRRESVQLHRG